MIRIPVGMLVAVAFAGCTQTRLAQRDGCWVKQTKRFLGGTSEEMGFCTRAKSQWAEDRAARLVQECLAEADFRWQNRALSAWTNGQPIPPAESDEAMIRACMRETAAIIGPEAENAQLKTKLSDLQREHAALQETTDGDREFLKQSSEKMVGALGEAAKKPAPSAVATATSTGTAQTETSHEQPAAAPPAPAGLTVVEVNGAPLSPQATPLPSKKIAAVCPQRKPGELKLPMAPECGGQKSASILPPGH